ncbi:4Fe-4S dicluster domain-containing protein [Peptostreptococcus faecalis]|uniref:4Fe-4S dicluster domain-containing protein n=1 Tax=Peptostreptococcus faecalis TaxID=2045015 RepID=UPI000C7E301D|nr:4Fe-4S dicluster domain-containing protein [Peptostreptococcus faecalis]
MSLKGIFTAIAKVRRDVFTEVARFAYDGDDNYNKLEEIPYNIIPGEIASHRESIFLERAIVGERVRLAMGMPLRKVSEHAPLYTDIDEGSVKNTIYKAPFVNIIKFACNSCPDNVYKTTDICRGCLARPCIEVCPKDAISMVDGKSFIDQEKCIKCGRCQSVCPYSAITKLERPCAKSCGMDAITSDKYGRASIDYDKCVSCGVCISSCPFGAIADKSQIFQLINEMKSGEKVIAEIAPAFIGQFGPKVTPEKLRAALLELGFFDVVEVAIGADLCTIEEAEDFMTNVPEKLDFMATSCCPSWSVMAKKLFPEFRDNISMAMTPMVFTARFIKRRYPDTKVVFIGPCVSKKLEATRKSVKSHVDFVLTYEEVMGMFEAKGINLEEIEPASTEKVNYGTGAGRGFAVSGGVANAVVDLIKKSNPDMEIPIDKADGLKECRNMLLLAKAGKRNGYLLEGMACPGGCVAGTGTIQPVKKSAASVNTYKKKAELQIANESKYTELLSQLDDTWFDEWDIEK